MINFLHYVPVEETMEFEQNFEPQFRFTVENKKEFLKKCQTTWLFVDDQIAAEIYSIPVEVLVNQPTPEKDDENIKADIVPYLGKCAAYYYSASILPNYRKQGLLKSLVDIHNRYLKLCGFKIGLAHSTANGIETLASYLKAKQLNCRENWFGSQRISKFYEFEISQFSPPRIKHTDRLFKKLFENTTCISEEQNKHYYILGYIQSMCNNDLLTTRQLTYLTNKINQKLG